jgi:predicted esterase
LLCSGADYIIAVAEQFQSNDKLSWMHWIIPNAEENRNAMQTAWYSPTNLSAPADRPDMQDEEDEAGMLKSVQYIESLIDACTRKGIPPQRIVLGGFSQGHAMSLLTDLVSQKYSGRLAGIVGLMGYLPLSSGYRINDLRAHAGLPPVVGDVPVFLARGQKDVMIPKRVWNSSLKKLEELGLSEDSIEVHEYEGLGHSLSGPLLRDLCGFLERAVPKLED